MADPTGDNNPDENKNADEESPLNEENKDQKD